MHLLYGEMTWIWTISLFAVIVTVKLAGVVVF